jgi:hypothetical protein
MPDPEEDPPGPSAQKSAFKPVDSDQFQIGTRTRAVSGHYTIGLLCWGKSSSKHLTCIKKIREPVQSEVKTIGIVNQRSALGQNLRR